LINKKGGKNMQTVGVIGLGIMGSSYVRNLLKNGFAVVGYDLDQRRVAELEAEGMQAAGSACDVARQAGEIITSLPSPQALHQVVEELLTLGSRLTEIVVGDTCTLAMTDKMQAMERMKAAGGLLLDCPVSGTGAQAAKGDLIVFASGDAQGIERMMPAFSGIGRLTHNLGIFGNGSKMKYVANLLVTIHNVSAGEAFAFAQKAGIAPELAYKAVFGGAGSSRIFEVRGPMMVAGDYLTGLSATHRLMHKDISIIGDYIDALGADTPLCAVAAGVHNEAIAQGLELHDTASVCAVMEKRNGITRS
jgi:3-hydroxyisobutyrate dehydrogenase-like beta-hydroxyacid dehydrogenase